MNFKKSSQIDLKIYKHLNKNCYQEKNLLCIGSFNFHEDSSKSSSLFCVYYKSLEEIQLKDDRAIDTSNIRRDFLKIHQKQGAKMNVSDQDIEFIFTEDENYHQIGNLDLQYDITVAKVALPAVDSGRPSPHYPDFFDGNEIRLMITTFANTFEQGRIATTGGADIEEKELIGKISTIRRVLTLKV